MKSMKDALTENSNDSFSRKFRGVQRIPLGDCPECRNGTLPNGKAEPKRPLYKLVFGDGTEKYEPCVCHKERAVNHQQRFINAEKVDAFSIIDPEYQDATFEAMEIKTTQQQKARQQVGDYIDAIDDNIKQGRGLFFQGSYGTGKTYMSAVVRRHALEKGYAVLFITFGDYFSKITAHQKDFKVDDPIVKIAAEADLVIMDEVNAELNRWQADELYRFANMRENKSTIYTTNYKSDAFKETVRLHQSLTRMVKRKEIVLLNGADYRMKGML